MLAINNARHTYVEKPSVLDDVKMSWYCGIYGTTPPNTIAPEAVNEINVIKLTAEKCG